MTIAIIIFIIIIIIIIIVAMARAKPFLTCDPTHIQFIFDIFFLN